METIRVRPNVVLRVPALRLPFVGGAATPESLSETLDNIYSTTWQLMKREVVDNVFTATPLWYWLYSKERIKRVEGGRWIGCPLLYAKNTTVASVGSGGQVSITQTNTETTGKYDWKTLAGSVVRLRTEDQQNRGQHQIRSLIEDKIKTLELSLIDTLETQAFGDGSGNNGLDILGLKAIVRSDPATNPPDPPGNVGGIDAATNTWWRNKQRTWSTTGVEAGDSNIAFNMRKLYNALTVGNDHPTLLLTDTTQYEAYEAALTNKLQVYEVKGWADLGFQGLTFKGSVVTFSPSAPAQTLYELNERYLTFYIDTMLDFNMTEWKSIPDQPFDRVAQVVVTGNLTTSNRRMQGVLTGMPA